MTNIDTSVLYADNTIPLERIEYEDLVPDCTYITRDGSRIKVMDDNDFELVKLSPLCEGERVGSLSNANNYAMLRLFFKILNKE